MLGDKAADDVDYQHLRKCKELDCLRCRFAAYKTTWCKRLPVCQPKLGIDSVSLHPSKKKFLSMSWLEGRQDEEKGFTVGCICCEEAEDNSAIRFASDMTKKSFQVHNFLKHHNSKAHRANVMSFLKVDLGPRSLPTASAPPEEHYSAYLGGSFVWNKFPEQSINHHWQQFEATD